MTVFKAFLKVLNQCKVPVILFTVILIVFGGFQIKNEESSAAFTASRPDILIINNDEYEGLTKSLVDYMTDNCEIIDIGEGENAADDALFYRDVNYIISIPEHYSEDFLAGKAPEIEVKSTGDYQASYAEMLLSRYVKLAETYVKYVDDEEMLVEKVEETLSKQTEVVVTSALDANSLSKAVFYYNFATYSILAGCVYAICLILSGFKDEKIRKRTVISSMNIKTYNRQLLLSNGLFAVVMWLLYVLLSFVLVGGVMFSARGLLFVLNCFVFTFCALTLAFLIGNLVTNKNAINGIVNVIALGASFLCGAFVPVEYLPDSVLTVAHILPSYWYIQTNEFLKKAEVVNTESLRTVFINMGMILVFAMLFVAAANIVSRRKQRIG